MRPCKGLQDVPQGMFPTALGCRDVVKVVFKRSYLFFRQSHTLFEPAPMFQECQECISSNTKGLKTESLEYCLLDMFTPMHGI